MSTRRARAQLAAETLAICAAGTYRAGGAARPVAAAAAAARAATVTLSRTHLRRIVRAAHAAPARRHHTRTECVCERTLQGAAHLADALRERAHSDDQASFVFVMNFASAKNPGGGFRKGSQAQEESLARSSNLFECLQDSEMYRANRRDNRNMLYQDMAIYTPQCVFFRDDDGELLEEPLLHGVATVPMPNAGCLRHNVPEELLHKTLTLRIHSTLAIAHHFGHTHLVLGAAGCGVFRNDVRVVARIFARALDGPFRGLFEHVTFSITPDNCDKFRDAYVASGGHLTTADDET